MKKMILLVFSSLGLMFLISNMSIRAKETSDLEAELNDFIEKGYFSEEVTLEDYKLAKQDEAKGLAWMEEEEQRFEAEQAQREANQ